jgi:gluconokinase
MADELPILALDLGTSSVKALAVDPDGRVAARAERPLVTLRPQPGRAEQDAEAALSAAAEAVAEVLASDRRRPAALALSCAMHGVIPLGADGAVLGPLRTWADARGAGIARRWRADGSWRALQERTGTPVHASSPLCKIAAIAAEEPELFAAARRFVSLKELLLLRWCGAAVVDLSLATATGLCALRTGAWDEEALALAGIDAGRLSTIQPTRHRLTAVAGPARGLPVVVGASDGCLANLGVGAVVEGLVAVTLGTSGAARAVVDAPGIAADSGLFCYALDAGEWVVGGAVDDMGNALQWAADHLFAEVEAGARVVALLASAAAAPPGARGARFVPRLGGSRFPDYDSRPRGGFVDLSIAHGRDDLARAVVEGLIDGLGGVVDALRTVGLRVDEVRAGGGLLRSKLVAGLLEQRVAAPLRVAEVVDASALGAALLARR